MTSSGVILRMNKNLPSVDNNLFAGIRVAQLGLPYLLSLVLEAL